MATLNPRQERFCEEYLVDLNGQAAYKRAGYQAKTDNVAKVGAARLLTNANVQARIQQLKDARSERTAVTADRVITELARIAFSDLRKVATWGAEGLTLCDSEGITDDAAAAVESVSQTTTQAGGSIRIKLHPKAPALRQLAEHTGVLKDPTPLEMLLALLPAGLAEQLRGALDRQLAAGGDPAGGGQPR